MKDNKEIFNGIRMSNLHLRILTGAVLGVIVPGLTWLGGCFFVLFSVFTGAAVFDEWNRMCLLTHSVRIRACGWIFYGLVSLALFFCASFWVVFSVLLASIVLLAWLSDHDTFWVIGGLVYSAAFPVMLCLLRQHETFGVLAVFFLYAVVWGTDIGAYFFGRILGGPRLAPLISPRKTWSGAVGGLIIGMIGGVYIPLLLVDIRFSPVSLCFLALVLSVVSQIGDLVESAIKRRFQVKDSGNLLPGHGGVMDRVDGLIFASIALYVIGAVTFGVNTSSNLFSFL